MFVPLLHNGFERCVVSAACRFGSGRHVRLGSESIHNRLRADLGRYEPRRSGYGIVNHDYRMGTYEITNDQWNKFTASLGVPVTGADGGYGYSSYFTGTNVPTDRVSWYEAAQFVNWLNTSTGHQAAYKFTGTQGTSDYTFAAWSPTDAGYDASNPYRNKTA